MLGRFAPRSIELICETLSWVRLARSLQRTGALGAKHFDRMPKSFPKPVLIGTSEAIGLDRIL